MTKTELIGIQFSVNKELLSEIVERSGEEKADEFVYNLADRQMRQFLEEEGYELLDLVYYKKYKLNPLDFPPNVIPFDADTFRFKFNVKIA